MDDYEECYAEFVDGIWSYCGCTECCDREREDDEDYDERDGYASW